MTDKINTAAIPGPLSLGFKFDSHYTWCDEAPDEARPLSSREAWNDLSKVTYTRDITSDMTLKVHKTGLMSLTTAAEFTNPRKTGFVGVDVSSLMTERSRQIRYLNALSICLHSGLSTVDGILVEPVLAGADNFVPLAYSGMGELTFISGEFGTGLFSSGSSGISSTFGTIQSENCETGVQLFGDVVTHASGETLSIVALLNEAAVAYKAYNFPLATVAGWSICERLQSKAWRQYYEGKGVLTGGRREFLEGRDSSASVVSSVPELAGQLTPAIRSHLDAARKARNKWLHSGDEPTVDGVRVCIDAAIEMIEMLLGLRFSVRNDLGIFY